MLVVGGVTRLSRGEYRHTSTLLAFMGSVGWDQGPRAFAASTLLSTLARPTTQISILFQHKNCRAHEITPWVKALAA